MSNFLLIAPLMAYKYILIYSFISLFVFDLGSFGPPYSLSHVYLDI